MEDKKIVYVIEVYTDEERTLEQRIVYHDGDFRERDWFRKKINPHLTVLKNTRYLNKDWKVIKEER